jgi:KaiC/GvpD/RAD55 family RecA-like ATPase
MTTVPDDMPPTGNVHLLPGVSEKILLQLLTEVAKREGWILAPKAREIGGDDVTLSEELAEFFASCKDKIDWLLEPYVFDGGFTIIQGAPKSGKTLLVAWITVCVALAGKKVLFVEEEGARETLRDRLKPFVPDPKLLRGKLFIMFRKRVRLDKQKSVDALIAEVRRTCARLLVLDPFIAMHARKEKDEDEMALVLSAIQQIITETGCAVLLVHHTRKGDSWNKESNREAQSEDARGSGAIIGNVDHVIAVKGLPPSKRVDVEVTIIVENPDTRVSAPFKRKSITFRLEDGTMSEIDEEAQRAALADDLRARVLAVLPTDPQFIPARELRDALRVGKVRLDSVLSVLHDEGLLTREVNKGVAKRGRTADRNQESPSSPSGLPVGLDGLGGVPSRHPESARSARVRGQKKDRSAQIENGAEEDVPERPIEEV